MKSKAKLLLVFLLSLAMMMSACAGQASQQATPVPVTNNAPAQGGQQGTPANSEDTNQELIILTGSDFSSFDPHFCNDSGTESVNKNIYNNLVTFDEQTNIVADLAESWDVSADSLTWTFQLRQDVLFHDGTPFNGEAVKVTFERVLDPETGSPNRSILEMIAQVNVVDEFTVEIKTSTPCGSMLSQLAHPVAAIFSPTALAANGENFATNPVGTGPFKFVEWVNGDHATIERNEDYFRGPAKLARVTYRIVPDNSTRALLLESGGGDVALRLPSTETDRLENNANLVIDKSDTIMTMYVPMNMSKETPLQDVRVRQAMNYATDREAIINTILGGLATLADAPISPLTWGYYQVGAYPYDVEKAKSLLAEAGYPDGIDLSIWTPTGRYQMDTQVVQVLQGQWEKAGIRVKIQQWETQAMFAELKNAEFDMLYMGWSPSTVDVGRGLDPFHSATASFNFAHYSNPEVDALLDAGKTEVDLVKRGELYRQAQEKIMEEAPWVFLYYAKQVVVHSASISGLKILASEHILLHEAAKAA